MSKHLADYYQSPVEITGGDGCWLSGPGGKRYLDFLAGWCVGNIGWKNPKVKQAIKEQADRGFYVPPLLSFAGWEDFAKLLIDRAPGSRLKRVFRATSGSEAVEFAVKCARAASGKSKIVSIAGVYHGHTYAAASVGNACSSVMEPCLPETVKIPMPNAYREIDGAKVLAALEEILAAGEVAAFLSEPVWSNAGAIIPPAGFYPAVQKLCRKYGALLIMDEVATGFGRCGELFASQLWDLEPDIVCLGKGLTGGYATLGATLVSEEIFAASGHIPYYSTFGWLPQDMAATRANVEVILENQLWKNAKTVGDHLLTKLQTLSNLSFVGEVRGLGLLLGVEIVKNKTTKSPDFHRAQKIQDECARQGLIIETAHNTLFITPPLILTAELADQGFAILERVMRAN